MKFELCLVFAIVLTLKLSQEKVQGYSNIGLVVQNLTRLPTEETCNQNNRNCKYYMELCFFVAGKPDCSLFDRTSLTWVIKPGRSKILRLGDDAVQYIENPLRFPEVDRWKAQEVVLRANVRKTDQPDFTEEILIKEKLPYPINDLTKLEENRITKCSVHFCLTVALYMWCDDIPGCVDACASKPCKNDGECVNADNGGYQCNCTPNWEGKDCELPKYCPAASSSKWGCYKTPRPRPATSKLFFNRRNDIDWLNGWDKFLETIVCDCGKAAKREGYRYFCIEYYGECWGYKEFDVTQPHAGATKCWGKRPNYETCIHDQKNPICVGTNYHGYIYEVN